MKRWVKNICYYIIVLYYIYGPLSSFLENLPTPLLYFSTPNKTKLGIIHTHFGQPLPPSFRRLPRASRFVFSNLRFSVPPTQTTLCSSSTSALPAPRLPRHALCCEATDTAAPLCLLRACTFALPFALAVATDAPAPPPTRLLHRPPVSPRRAADSRSDKAPSPASPPPPRLLPRLPFAVAATDARTRQHNDFK